jgi:endonuclease-3
MRNAECGLEDRTPVPKSALRIPHSPIGERCRAINAELAIEYPDAECELEFGSPLELLIATILSAQCTDERVNQVTPGLFAKYRRPEDYLAVPVETLEAEIHSTGFYRNKAKSIRGACQRMIDAYGGRVPDTMEELLTLPGVARKTANVVLGNAFGKAEGIAVDTHVLRLSGRLGLTAHDRPEKIEQDLMALLPREEWTNFSHRLILHGRRVCYARKPDCPRCRLREICPTYGATVSLESPEEGNQ